MDRKSGALVSPIWSSGAPDMDGVPDLVQGKASIGSEMDHWCMADVAVGHIAATSLFVTHHGELLGVNAGLCIWKAHPAVLNVVAWWACAVCALSNVAIG